MDINELSNTLKEVHVQLLNYSSHTINLSVTIRNWLFGYFIQEYELNGSDRARYGEKIVKNLATMLQSALVPSSSHRHLKLCRQFYQAYPQIGQTVFAQFKNMIQNSPLKSISAIGQAMIAQSENKDMPSLPAERLINCLSYSHFVELIRIDIPLKRSFYEVECVLGNWSTRELKRQITSLYYERSGLSKNPHQLSELIKKGAQVSQPTDIIRDPYVFEFLGIKSEELLLESKLADALLHKLQKFLLELGRGFCFEARNKKILIGDEYFFIDLVFYHRILKCGVLIELKTDAFNHHNIGQLNTYINYYKKHEMHPGDNLPIGILLCTEKNQALVEYTLGDCSNQLFVSRYKLELPSEEVMKNFIEQQLKEELKK